MASRKVFVVGVGMTKVCTVNLYAYYLFESQKFEKPGRRENFDYPDMVRESGRA